MNGNWLRVTPAELDRAKDDLEWAYELAEEATEAQDDRWLSTSKAWHALDHLLNRYGFEVPLVFGSEAFVADSELEELPEELDWGYGPPRYLPPGKVAAAAAALADLTPDDLLRGVQPADLVRENIYPHLWDEPDSLPWITHTLPEIKEYFAAAAARGDAVICWLD
jgi:hypothetical protein